MYIIYIYIYIHVYIYIYTHWNQPTTRLDWHKETEVSACRERLCGPVMISGAKILQKAEIQPFLVSQIHWAPHFWLVKTFWHHQPKMGNSVNNFPIIKPKTTNSLRLIHSIHGFIVGKSSTPKHGPLSVAQKLAQATNAKSDATNRPGTRWSNHNWGMFLTKLLW